jgi:hypothetical protein
MKMQLLAISVQIAIAVGSVGTYIVARDNLQELVEQEKAGIALQALKQVSESISEYAKPAFLLVQDEDIAKKIANAEEFAIDTKSRDWIAIKGYDFIFNKGKVRS